MKHNHNQIPTKKRTIRTSITLLMVTLCVGPGYSICNNGCIQCGFRNLCDLCYKTQPTSSTTEGCSTQTSTKNCLFNVPGLDKCTICDKGYALRAGIGACNRPVTKIPNCVNQIETSKGSLCYACNDGHKPSRTKQRCSTGSPLGNCRWTAIGVQGNYECLKCAPGYAYNRLSLKCEKIDVVGCLTFEGDPRACSVCDGFDGYYQKQYHGDCVQQTK